MRRISDLSTDERIALRRLVEVPSIVLGAKIGRFEPPYNGLSEVTVTFNPLWRFVLSAAASGNEEAFWIREFRIRQMLPASLTGGVPPEDVNRLRQYIEDHAAEIDAFEHAYYPWRDSQRVMEAKKPGALADLLDDVVGRPLHQYGFSLEKRRKKSEWRCTSLSLGTPLTLYVDKGSWKMQAYLEAPELLVHQDVGHPFFFAQILLAYGAEHEFELRVRSVFAEYLRIFPAVIQSVESAVPIRDAWLAGNEEDARELARRLIVSAGMV